MKVIPAIAAETLKIEDVLTGLNAKSDGLSNLESQKRLEQYGPNIIDQSEAKSFWKILLKQFLNPLIYILIFAALISLSLEHYGDVIFILIIIWLNALLGSFQEYSAERSAYALRHTDELKAIVKREGKTLEVLAQNLVLGDIVLLESGKKVPADLRLIASNRLEVDESFLTGESLPVLKDHTLLLDKNETIGDKKNMSFAGSLITQGRATGVVSAVGMSTELGKIADSLVNEESAKPPLLIRLEAFTKKIAFFLLLITGSIAAVLLFKGQPLAEVLLITVALAVSSIPEGLPVAITIALSVASRKMAKRNVIVRHLPAVEALGSCTFIATDKTGTLTVNQLTIKKIWTLKNGSFEVEGSGVSPEGKIISTSDSPLDDLNSLILAGVLCNEGILKKDNEDWKGIGDAVDLAFLTLAHKHNLSPDKTREDFKLIDEVPFEPQNQYAATLHSRNGDKTISVKGAFEKVSQMCPNVDAVLVKKEIEQLASNGFRILALAGKRISNNAKLVDELNDLEFYGLVAMIDPLRPEVKDAIQSCKQAGVDIAMVTGDHPLTALAISKELGFAQKMSEVVTGQELKLFTNEEEKKKKILSARVFARVEPQQKLEIVQTLIREGKFVAVTGDGANDASALRVANVGLAMGLSGSDVAKEASDLILTDDSFASIVAGIEEGRIAYANIRKVVYLLISTGAAEILIFILSLIFNTPLPLTAVQILWLNLVTNGIQDIGIAFEPAEGDELKKKPRHPNEPIFDRLMIERVIISALVMGGVSFVEFYYLIDQGVELNQARNLTLLLMVLFQNVMVGNCRSETLSVFKLNLFSNPILIIGTVLAQVIHVASMYFPPMQKVLGVQPVSLNEWLLLGLSALSVLVVMEVHKMIRRNTTMIS